MSLLVGAASNGPSGYFLDDSLRFRSSASASLTRTYGTPTSARIFTLSMWVKRGKLGSLQQLYSGFTDSTNRGFIAFQSGDFIAGYIRNSGGDLYEFSTSALFRDTSAWYHIVVAFDTTQGTATNRVKVYVNGVQHTLTLTTTTQDVDLSLNTSGSGKAIGQSNSIEYFDGYMAEINFVDGQQLTASDFGETDDNGTWVPKKYTGTYGTNGFYLNFSDGSSVAALGTDSSGNSNTWTVNNVSLTAGATYDLMPDVPTLTDEDTSNFATLNPNNMAVNTTMTDGNLKASNSVNHATMFPTNMPTTGKYYFECKMAVNATLGLGFRTDTNKVESAYSDEANKYYFYLNNSNAYRIVETTNTALGANLNSTTSTFQVAIDFDAAKYYFGVNNTWYAADWGTDGDPASGTNPSYDLTDGTKMFPFVYVAGGTWTVNFGQQPFTYTPPTGFKKINAYNLPDSTVEDGSDYMNNKLWTGNGTNQDIDVGWDAGLIWYRNRTDASGGVWTDIVRGDDLHFQTTNSNAEGSFGDMEFITNGYNVAGNANLDNLSGKAYVGWNWLAGGTGSTNNDGSITSTVSVNTTAGFSIVSYAGSNAAGTIGHGLGNTPDVLITKNRNEGTDGNWVFWHSSMTNAFSTDAYYMYLNSTQAQNASGGVFYKGTDINATTYGFQSGNTNVNASGDNYITYAFAPVEGYSKFDGYTGNGSADGPFIYTGFRPAFVLIKITSTTDEWVIYDTARDTYNVANKRLNPNSTIAEQTSQSIDIVSNGFKPRSTGANINQNAATYIYMAFAENPFKNSNAR